MNGPHGDSGATGRRGRRSSLGDRTFACHACRRIFNERSGTPFNELQYPTDLVLLAVRWRLRYKRSVRDVAELLLPRGVEVTHETIRAWEFRFAPLLADQLRRKRRGRAGVSWYLDETYVKVAGRWGSLYRAIDGDGELLDSMLSEHRDKHAARRFLRRLLEVGGRNPRRVTTDHHPADRKAIRWILGRRGLHRRSQYLNNLTEQDHRAIKQRSYPMLGFGRFESAALSMTGWLSSNPTMTLLTTASPSMCSRRSVNASRGTSQTLSAGRSFSLLVRRITVHTTLTGRGRKQVRVVIDYRFPPGGAARTRIAASSSYNLSRVIAA